MIAPVAKADAINVQPKYQLRVINALPMLKDLLVAEKRQEFRSSLGFVVGDGAVDR